MSAQTTSTLPVGFLSLLPETSSAPSSPTTSPSSSTDSLPVIPETKPRSSSTDSAASASGLRYLRLGHLQPGEVLDFVAAAETERFIFGRNGMESKHHVRSLRDESRSSNVEPSRGKGKREIILSFIYFM
ncbi:hypothetical protein K461DRAFT_297938 [Myriangium duriaei CBS 260.36]|uniref:Uncharacterized protein n=1 Tax=Myriangium duriaei CBS 260.36 TaxID=1168546 RepID=A0A9P4MD44_9PEZI|nr:hypothetical protein K461DRAFT_297938 [Myriangium duriaei CBS 260.36]